MITIFCAVSMLFSEPMVHCRMLLYCVHFLSQNVSLFPTLHKCFPIFTDTIFRFCRYFLLTMYKWKYTFTLNLEINAENIQLCMKMHSHMCCDMDQNDTIGKNRIKSLIVLSSDNTDCKNDIQLFHQLFDELSVHTDYH